VRELADQRLDRRGIGSLSRTVEELDDLFLDAAAERAECSRRAAIAVNTHKPTIVRLA
jgi:hypothetical protein